MNVVGIIPCKSTSTRVKDKNTRIVGGRPLWEWTWAAATRRAPTATELVGTMIVTDDPRPFEDVHPSEIVVMDPLPESVELAMAFAAERWQTIAEERVDAQLAMAFAAERWQTIAEERVDALMLLNPTSPLRTTVRINDAIALLEAGADSVVSVCRNGSSQFRWRNNPVQPDYDLRAPRMRTQDGPWFEENGAIYAIRADAFKTFGRLIAGTVALLEMDEWESIDVDTEHDLDVAGWMLGRTHYGLGRK